jgi:hypothetical protein
VGKVEIYIHSFEYYHEVDKDNLGFYLLVLCLLLRRIYGPVQNEEGWRMRSNDELEKLMRTEDAVKYIRAQRIKCWGKLNRMEKNRNREKDYRME